MNTYTISQKRKNKHLQFHHYEFIINELIKFNAEHANSRRNIGKTHFINHLASIVGTSVSNIYSIIRDASITVRDTYLVEHTELSALAAFEKRSKNHKIPNNSKLVKAHDFIKLVETEMKSNKLSSVDETINYLILHENDKIKDMETVSTKTFYNYIHAGKVKIKPIDLPRMLRRKSKKNDKTYISKRQKGTSITERPEHIESREEFGHWEGDLVVGPRNGQNGAYLTLIERKTRFYYMIPITSQSSKRFICRSTSFINFMETVLKKSLSLLPLIMEVSFQDGEIWKSNLVQKRSVQPFILEDPITHVIELLMKIVTD